jgi:hypothetical protein
LIRLPEAASPCEVASTLAVPTVVEEHLCTVFLLR